MKTYLITYKNYLEKLRILGFPTKEEATAFAAETPADVTAILATKSEDLREVGPKILVAVHNVMVSIADGATPSPRNVSRFENRAIAEARTFAAMEKAAEDPATHAKRHKAVADKVAAPKAAKEPKVAKPKGERKARSNSFDEAGTVTILVDKNPKLEGSQAAARFALYRNGMKVATAIEKGVTRADVAWDVAHSFISVT